MQAREVPAYYRLCTELLIPDGGEGLL